MPGRSVFAAARPYRAAPGSAPRGFCFLRSFSRKGMPHAFAPRRAVARFGLRTGPTLRGKQPHEPPHDAPRNIAATAYATVYAAQAISLTNYYTLPGETL
jgi:hypothetical protein